MTNKYAPGAVDQISTELRPVYPVLFGRIIWSETFYTYIQTRFSQAVASEINKLWGSFFSENVQNLTKISKMQNKTTKNFGFSDNYLWMGCIKLSLLGREHLSWALIVLTNSLKLLHITKRDFSQLNCPPVDQ